VEYQTIRLDKQVRNNVRLDLVTLVACLAPAAKTAGSMVPYKPDHQCGSGPRAQYSDDNVASVEAILISFGRLPFRTARAGAGQKRRDSCHTRKAELPGCP
jgi:hypothetical protein